MIAVCDASPLIAMSRVGLLNILKDYFKEIYIPEAVYREVVIEGGSLFGAEEVAHANWIKTGKVKNNKAVDALCMSIHRGESEAIILGSELNADIIIIDDLDGKRAAEEMGLNATGTLGLLVRAASDNKIDLKRVLNQLKSSGFRISDKLYNEILEL